MHVILLGETEMRALVDLTGFMQADTSGSP